MTVPDPPPGALPVRQAAELLGVTESAVRDRVKRGTLQAWPAKSVENPTRWLLVDGDAVERERRFKAPSDDPLARELDLTKGELEFLRREAFDGKLIQLQDENARLRRALKRLEELVATQAATITDLSSLVTSEVSTLTT